MTRKTQHWTISTTGCEEIAHLYLYLLAMGVCDTNILTNSTRVIFTNRKKLTTIEIVMGPLMIQRCHEITFVVQHLEKGDMKRVSGSKHRGKFLLKF